MSIENKLPEIIKTIDEICKDLDGPYKAALLKTAAVYYENMSQAEMAAKIYVESLKKVL